MKVLAFDLGRVLFDFDYSVALTKIEKYLNSPPPVVIKALFYEGFAEDFEKGLISARQFYRNFNDNFTHSGLDYKLFIDTWCDIFTPAQEVIVLVEKISGRYPLFLISNINQPHFEFLNSRFSKIFNLFDGLVLSFRAKSIKPEFRIYDSLRQRAGVDFEDIIYIDDRADLIEAAGNFNLNCIHFKGPDSLIRDLQRLKVEIN